MFKKREGYDIYNKEIYPFDNKYIYTAELERINMTKEHRSDIARDKGFDINTEFKNINKALTDEDGLFSSRFGQTLQDMNLYAFRYKCKCGKYTGRIYHGIKCDKCKTVVKHIGDDFEYYGWININKPYYIIHPNFYNILKSLVGPKEFETIITPKIDKDQDGFDKDIISDKKESPFIGIGILGLKDNFDDILEYYIKKKPNKRDHYDDLKKNKNLVFINNIPVFTTHLRPFKIDNNNKDFHYEKTNTFYVMILSLVSRINRDKTKIDKNNQVKNKLIYDLQMQFNALAEEIILGLKGKSGDVRIAVSGKCNYTSRLVIVPNPLLEIYQIKMSYYALAEKLNQPIKNILMKSYNITSNEADNIMAKATYFNVDERVVKIIQSLIDESENGIPCIINRPPTLFHGSTLAMNIVGMTFDFTLQVPLQILQLMNGDHDGDQTSNWIMLNSDAIQLAQDRYNPRNSMMISSNDGLFNTKSCHFKDLLVNANTFIKIGRQYYTEEDKENILKAIEMDLE